MFGKYLKNKNEVKKYSLIYLDERFGTSFIPNYFYSIQVAKDFARLSGYECFKVEDNKHIRYASLENMGKYDRFIDDFLKYQGFSYILPHNPNRI